MNDRPSARRAPRESVVVALTTAALVAVFVAAAHAHSQTMNTDVGRFDQDLYLAGARELRESAYAASTNRVNMPVYLYFQSVFYDPGGTIDANFARGKWANVALSVAVLGALHAFFSRTLPRFEARTLTLVVAFTVYVFRAAYVQAECLFYAVFFASFVALCRMWTRPTWGRALAAGVLAAAAQLTKGSVLPGLALFAALFVGRELRGLSRRDRATAGGGARLSALAQLGALGASFLATLAPYLRTSKAEFGSYFFAAGPSYAMWLDSWDEWLERERLLGSYRTWHTLPPEKIPSLGNYLRTHGLGQVVGREARGLAEMLGNTALSHGYLEYVALFVGFAGLLAWQRRRARIGGQAPAPPWAGFATVYVVFYLFLFAFYAPIAAGNRLVLTLLLPTLYTVVCANAYDVDAAVVAFGRTISWRDLTWFVAISIALHIAFRLPATITRIPAGG